MNSAAIDHSKITLLDYCNLAFLNGVHHWCGSSVTDDNEAVVSFDMSHEVCGSIKLPNGVFNKQSLPQQDRPVGFMNYVRDTTFGTTLCHNLLTSCD